jgi:ABC-type Fe3+/spermidine/putrescine transport system ATPase subunit
MVAIPEVGCILAPAGDGYSLGSAVIVCVRPEKMRVTRSHETTADFNAGKGRLKDITRVGSHLQLLIQLENGQIIEVDQHPDFGVNERQGEPGETLSVRWAVMDSLLFADGGDDLR